MQQLLIYFFIAIGLSMDAFSLALAYGTTKINRQKIITLSIFVGIFHFLMPLLGSLISSHLLESLFEKADTLVAGIFFLLAIEMFLSRKETKKGAITNMLSILLFSFTVSIDSFSVGLALGITEKSILISCIIFAITSAIFTLFGLVLGKRLTRKLGIRATYLGIIILILLGLNYLF